MEPMTTYAASCTFCGATVLTVETIRSEDIEPLADHLRAQHPLEIVGVRTWKLIEVMRRYRLTAV
jgi:hypothetical protein